MKRTLRFPDDPKLVTSDCYRRIGDSSYFHREHKEGEYCYQRDKENKEKASANIGNDDSDSDESDESDDSTESKNQNEGL